MPPMIEGTAGERTIDITKLRQRKSSIFFDNSGFIE
jgi:hypothetical protein